MVIRLNVHDMTNNITVTLTFFVINAARVTGILGGKEIDISHAAYHVNYGNICGGVLIHRMWALTVAHCGTNINYIRVGTKHRLKSPRIKIKNHYIHTKYQKEHNFDYDVQLLELFRQLRYGRTVKNIEICDGECGGSFVVAGWGYTKEKGEYEDILRQVTVRLVSIGKCNEIQKPWYNNTLTSRMFCAGNKTADACQGDSGSGAISYGRLAGLSSFGFGCGRVPGVYVNVSHPDIRSWIRRHTNI